MIHLVSSGQLSCVEFEKECYYLTDIHFHLPSEHIIDRKQEDTEFHFVHINSKKENPAVGIMYQLMEQEGWFYNQENGERWNLEKHEHWIDPNVFFPEKKSRSHHIGSLTTLPTNGSVQWLVMDHVEKLNQGFLLSFKGQYTQSNNQPIQPLNGREIYYFEEFERRIFNK